MTVHSLCEMNPSQVAVYINLWTVVITSVVSGVLSVVLYRTTSGLARQENAYQDGWDAALRAGAPRIDRNLALGLSDYDAQRVAADE